MAHKNIEIKARCKDVNFVKEFLKGNAKYVGTDNQKDTYFVVEKGRLKLREGNIENNLIYYDREDTSGPKLSKVILIPIVDDNMGKLLRNALKIKLIVEKQREIYFIGNVKFHIDKVRGLGNFIEIEAIDMSDKKNLQELEQQCRMYMKELNIADTDLIDKSYSDMLN